MNCAGCGRILFDGERNCESCQETVKVAHREHAQDYNERHHNVRCIHDEDTKRYRTQQSRGYA